MPNQQPANQPTTQPNPYHPSIHPSIHLRPTTQNQIPRWNRTTKPAPAQLDRSITFFSSLRSPFLSWGGLGIRLPIVHLTYLGTSLPPGALAAPEEKRRVEKTKTKEGRLPFSVFSLGVKYAFVPTADCRLPTASPLRSAHAGLHGNTCLPTRTTLPFFCAVLTICAHACGHGFPSTTYLPSCVCSVCV